MDCHALSSMRNGVAHSLPRALWRRPALRTDALRNAAGAHGNRRLLAKSGRTDRSPPVLARARNRLCVGGRRRRRSLRRPGSSTARDFHAGRAGAAELRAVGGQAERIDKAILPGDGIGSAAWIAGPARRSRRHPRGAGCPFSLSVWREANLATNEPAPFSHYPLAGIRGLRMRRQDLAKQDACDAESNFYMVDGLQRACDLLL